MKSKVIIIVFSVILFGLTSCGNRRSNNQDTHNHEHGAVHNHNTHTHADGTVHSDHAPEHDTPQQESFKVEADTVKHDHSHDGHDHTH